MRRSVADAKGDVQHYRNMKYGEYLLTKHWRTTRQMAIQAARGRCQACRGIHRLEVHHRTYERLGEEPLSDLAVLCHQCHMRLHSQEDAA